MMNLKHTTIKTRKRQAGLTLLELTVVLLVLIGLSGLILPYAQGYLQRTHDSTGQDNLWELNNAINLFSSKYLEQPEGWHTLIDSTGAVYGDLMNTSIVAPLTTTTINRMSLTMAGINTVWEMKTAASSASATFDAVSAQKTVTKGGALTLAAVTKGPAFASAAEHLAFSFYNSTSAANVAKFDTTCYDYVVFGVGPESEMVGTVMSDAPLHFSASGGMGPDKKYNRFVAVYQVDKDNTTAGCSEDTDPARLVGSAMLMGPNHLFGMAHSTAHVYEHIGDRTN